MKLETLIKKMSKNPMILDVIGPSDIAFCKLLREAKPNIKEIVCKSTKQLT